MTLLFCPHCTDAFTLWLDEWESCRCGNASGVLRSGLGGSATIAGGRLVHIDAAELIEALADGPVSLDVARIQRTAAAI